jgi:hypothetical protein
MKYTRAQILSFVDNTDPDNGTQVQLSDEPIRCDVWPIVDNNGDPVLDEEGNPTYGQWCPVPDGSSNGYMEFRFRMALEFAIKAHQNPNQTMLYFLKSPELEAAWTAADASVRAYVRTNAWVHYSGIWNGTPNIAAPQGPEKA